MVILVELERTNAEWERAIEDYGASGSVFGCAHVKRAGAMLGCEDRRVKELKLKFVQRGSLTVEGLQSQVSQPVKLSK